MKTKTSSKEVPTPFSRQSASRSSPLGSILVLVALTSCCTIQAGTKLVFNTLGPDCSHENGTGYPQFKNTDETAVKFTAETSGNLATVYLGLKRAGQLPPEGSWPVYVFLYGDAGGLPDITTQTYLGTVAPTEKFGSNRITNNVLRLVVAGRASVVKGLDYWLGVKPAFSPGPSPLESGDTWWANSLARQELGATYPSWYVPNWVGSVAFSKDSGVTWGLCPPSYGDPSGSWLPAFAITAWPRPFANFFRVLPEDSWRPPEWRTWPPPWPPPPHDLPRPN